MTKRKTHTYIKKQKLLFQIKENHSLDMSHQAILHTCNHQKTI